MEKLNLHICALPSPLSLLSSLGAQTLPPKSTLEALGIAALISIDNSIFRTKESEVGRFFLDSGSEYM